MNDKPQDYPTSDTDVSTPRTASTPSGDSDDAVRELQRGIEETRAEMSETIDALQERLSPAYLKDQVKEQVIEQVRHVKDSVRQATLGKVEDMMDRVSDSGRSIGETIKANPIPSALVGIGIAWLWMNRRSDSGRSMRSDDRAYGSSRYGDDRIYAGGGYDWRDAQGGRTSAERYDTYGSDAADEASGLAGRAGSAMSDAATRVQRTASNAANQVQRKASDLADRASSAISGAVDQAQQKAGYLAERAQYQARRVEDTFNQTLNDNPIALGAVAMALGTAVGLALPQTRKENELMGSARDSLLDKAQSAAHDAIDQVQEKAQQVTQGSSTGSSATPL